MHERTHENDLQRRRRRIRYRAWHRGMREMDLLLGRFADAELPGLNEGELAQFESLMELPDPDLYAWITGEAALPEEYDLPLLRRIVAFHGRKPGAPRS